MATESLVEMGGRSFFATSDAAEEHASEIESKNQAILQHCRDVLEIVKVHSFVKIEKKKRGRQPKKKATLVAAEKEVYAFKCTICSVDDVERGLRKMCRQERNLCMPTVLGSGLKLLSRKLLRALTKKSQPRERYIPVLTIRTLKIAPHSMIPPAD